MQHVAAFGEPAPPSGRLSHRTRQARCIRPRCSPQRNPIERLGKVRRRRARHHRLFDSIADGKKSVRASRSYFQTVRQRVLTLIKGRGKKAVK
jgi:hypothetical protein